MIDFDAVLRSISNPPDLWGEGALFAFSGMDGPTKTVSRFVAAFDAIPYDLLIHTPRRRVLRARLQTLGRCRIATGDLLGVETSSGAFLAIFAAWHTIVGIIPEEADLTLAFEHLDEDARAGARDVTWDPVAGDAVALARDGIRWSLAYGESPGEARTRADAGLRVDLDAVLEARLGIYRSLPTLPDDTHDRLMKKGVSVMRVNTLAPEGVNHQHWSTPDRVPHEHMWLWDSVFHSLGMNHLDPGLAWNFLKSVLARQQDDGMISHCMHVDGAVSAITQPPILAWGVWENSRYLKDRDAQVQSTRLAYALPRLERALAWNLEHRDTNDNGLLEWRIEETPTSRSGESGMDNSPRFDEALSLDAVDFSTFQALDMAYTARIAEALGDRERADLWEARASAMRDRIHRLLWHPDLAFYCDRKMDGTLSDVKAVSGFLPLLLPDLPVERRDSLLSYLSDPETFNTAFPIPSVSVDDPAWSTDMWRGATWINLDTLIREGLLRQGAVNAARSLEQAMLHYVNVYYEGYGVLFEFYDAKDEMPPVDCDRKGARREPYDLRTKMDSIRDYHWTAALMVDLLFDRRSDVVGGPNLRDQGGHE
jgi:hypothetical protein